MSSIRTLAALLLTLTLLLPWGRELLLHAQEDEQDLFVTITRLDSEAFPEMTAFVSVVDENGLPVGNLAEDDFGVLEDGVPTDAQSIQVSLDNSADLRLAMALDLSMPPAQVETMKTAVNRFIDTLKPQDQLALITFYDEIAQTQDFTSNKERLRRFVNDLEPIGNYTTLHETVVEATNLVEQFPVGRRAVIIVTNSGNNVESAYTAADAIDIARNQKVPLYIIGLETLNNLSAFQAVSEETGGQSYTLNQADDVENTLEDIKDVLQSGYKVDYISNIVPDNEDHQIEVTVRTDAGTVTSAGNTISPDTASIPVDEAGRPQLFDENGQPATIDENGQPILVDENGQPLVDLAGQPVLVDNNRRPVVDEDGQPVAVDVADLPVLFDEAGRPIIIDDDGQPTLIDENGQPIETPSETDSPIGGQLGRDTTTFVAVQDEIAIDLLGLEDEQTVGGITSLMSQVTAPARGVTVEYYRDDALINQSDTPPYLIEWNTNPVPPGVYTLTARAIDTAGNVGETSVRVNIPVQIAMTLLTTPPTTATVGTTVTLQAEVVSFAGVRRVEFFLGQQSLGFDDTPPYQLQLSTSDYAVGEYEVRARATNDFDGSAEAGQSLNLVTPTATMSWWQRFLSIIRAPYPLWAWLLCLLGLLPLVVLPFWFVLNQVRHKRKPSITYVEILNMGNIRSRYELQAANSEEALRFRFVLNQRRLAERQVGAGATGVSAVGVAQGPQRAEAVDYSPPSTATPVATNGQAAGQPATVGTPAGQQPAQASSFRVSNPFSQQNVQKLTVFGQIGGVLGEILLSVSYILPAAIGGPLRSLANVLRRAEQTSKRIETGAKRLDKLEGQANEALGNDGRSGGATAVPSQPTTASQPTVSQPTTVGQPPSAGQATAPPPPQQTGPSRRGFRVSNPFSQQNVQKLTVFGQIGGVLGEILLSVSYILPAAIGGPLRSLANVLRRAEQTSKRIETGAKRLDKLEGQANQALGNDEDGQTAQPMPPSAAAAPASPAATTTTTNQTGATTVPVQTGATTEYASTTVPTPQPLHPHALVPDAPIENWAETPYIEPGKSLTVDLWIEPIRPRRTRRYDFTVTARSVEQDDAPLVVEHGDLEIEQRMTIVRMVSYLTTFGFVIFFSYVMLTVILLIIGIIQ